MSAQAHPARIEVDINTTAVLIGGGQQIARGDIDLYGGPYEVTPTQATQTLQTRGHTLQNNVTVNPIPSNYGLITWNGVVLTVS